MFLYVLGNGLTQLLKKLKQFEVWAIRNFPQRSTQVRLLPQQQQHNRDAVCAPQVQGFSPAISASVQVQ